MSVILPSQIEQLARHAPFDRMESMHLLWLLERLQLAYYAQGEVILAPQQKSVEQFYIIKQGLVQEEPVSAVADVAGELHEGESFPVGELLAGRAAGSVYRAVEDVFCYELSAADFRLLLDLSAVFKDYCTRRIAALFEQFNQAMQAQLSRSASEQQSLTTPLADVIRRAPVSCAADTHRCTMRCIPCNGRKSVPWWWLM